MSGQIAEYEQGRLTILWHGDAGERKETVKVVETTEILRELQAREPGDAGDRNQRPTVRADGNWLDKGARIVLRARQGVATRIVIARSEIKPRRADPDEDGPRGLRNEVHTSTSVKTVDGHTVVMANGKEVWAGPTRGRVVARSHTVNGASFSAVFDGDKVIWENVPGAAAQLNQPDPAFPRERRRHDEESPIQEPVQEKPAEPVKLIPAGILLRDGGRIEGTIVAADATQIRYQDAQGKEAVLSTGKAAVLLLKAVPETHTDLLERNRRGVLLANGDFIEGDLVGLEAGKLTLASVLFGLKYYQTGREGVAVVLSGPPPKAAPLPPSLKGYAPTGSKN
jgi:hypothetical protein